MDINSIFNKVTSRFRRSDAAVFNELSQDYGGRLSDEDLGGYGSLMLEVCQDRLKRAQDGDLVDDVRLRAVYHSVSVHFVRNGRLNAFTVADKGRNYVGIYAGAPTTLADLCMTVMRCRDVFSGYGSVSESDAAAAHLSDVFWIAGVGTEQSNDRPNYREHLYELPTDAYRARLANELFIAAISFLFNHELCHVARGHLDYLGECGYAMTIFEAVSDETESQDYRLRQWLELDADRRGAFFVLDLFDWEQPWSGHGVEPTDDNTHHPATALRLTFLAIGLIFAIFDHRAEPVQPGDRSTHPHPAIRLAHVYELIVEFLVEYYNAPLDQCMEIMSSALQDLNNIGMIIDRNIVGYSYGAQQIIESELKKILAALEEEKLKSAWQRLHQRV